nr:hypothetical protein [Paracoccus saliphilus]
MTRARLFELISRREAARLAGLSRDRAAVLGQAQQAEVLSQRLSRMMDELAPRQGVTAAATLRDAGLLAASLAAEADRQQGRIEQARQEAERLRLLIGQHDHRRRLSADAASAARVDAAAEAETRAATLAPARRNT